MFKPALILAAIAAMHATPSHACKDSFTPAQDKQKHFAVEMAIGATSRLLIESEPVAFSVAMIPGVAKEIMDLKDPTHHCASFYDLAYDAAGALVGVKASGWIIRKNFVGYHTAF